MAGGQVSEKDAAFEELVRLQMAVLEAQAVATAGPYSAEAWRPWLDAADAFQAAVVVYAAAGEGRSRYETEMRAKKTAKERMAAV